MYKVKKKRWECNLWLKNEIYGGKIKKMLIFFGF
jgi:hypothetical protein